MRYTVTMHPSLHQRLADIWNHAPDRQAVSDASNHIDRILKFSPASHGEEQGDNRCLIVEPLAVTYRVYPDDQRVDILDVAFVG